MVRVEKNRKIEFLAQAPHDGRDLPDSQKRALAIGGADQDRDLEFLSRGEHRLQHHQVRDVEMPDRHSLFLGLLQSVS